MLTFTDEALRQRLRKSRAADVDAVAFLPFSESVRDDLALYDASPLVRHDIPVRGFVYDVKTGRLREVSARRSRGMGGRAERRAVPNAVCATW